MSVKYFCIIFVTYLLNYSNGIKIDFFEDSSIKDISQDTFKGYDVSHILEVSITWTNATSIQEDAFSGMNQLQDLSLEACHIRYLPSKIFENITTVEKINLNYNQIGNLDVDIFRNNKKLRDLSLSGLGIEELPENIFSNLILLKVLDLHRNNIKNLPENVFANLGALKYLSLSENYITNIHKNQFANCVKLKTILLYNNSLIEIHPETFKNNLGMYILSINSNKLKEIQNETFSYLSRIANLDLSHNEITFIHPGSIPNLNQNRSHISFNDNRLEYLDPEIILKVKNAEFFYLCPNPWNCDGKLKDVFKVWKRHHKIKMYGCVCAKPEKLNGTPWELLTQEDFA